MLYRTQFSTDRKDFLDLVNKIAEARADVVDIAAHVSKLSSFVPEGFHYPSGFENKLDKVMRRCDNWIFGYNEEAYRLEGILERNHNSANFQVTDVEIGHLSGMFISADYFLRKPANVAHTRNREMLERVAEVTTALTSSGQLDEATVDALNSWEQGLTFKAANLRTKLDSVRSGYFAQELLPMLRNYNRSLWSRVDRP